MIAGYRILQTLQHDDLIIAALPFSKILGNEFNQSLDEDYERLIQQASRRVVLDLRQVEFIDGSFFTKLLELRRGLIERSIRLTVQMSPDLAEVARVTKLDQLLEVVVSDGSTCSKAAGRETVL